MLEEALCRIRSWSQRSRVQPAACAGSDPPEAATAIHSDGAKTREFTTHLELVMAAGTDPEMPAQPLQYGNRTGRGVSRLAGQTICQDLELAGGMTAGMHLHRHSVG